MDVASEPRWVMALRGRRGWRLVRGMRLAPDDAHPGGCTALALSDDGDRVAIGGDHGFHVRDVATGDLLGTLQGHARWPSAACFHPSGTSLFSAEPPGGALIRWDLVSGSESGRVKLPGEDWLTRLRCSPAGDALLGTSNQPRHALEVRVEGELAILGERRVEDDAYFGFDERGGLLVAVVDFNELRLRLWRRQRDDSERLTWENSGPYPIRRVFFSTDGGALLAVPFTPGAGGSIIDVDTGETRAEVAFELPRGELHLSARHGFACDMGGRSVIVLDLATGERSDVIELSAAPAAPVMLATSRREERLAVALATGVVLVFERAPQ